MVRDAGRPAVAGDCPADVSASSRSHDARAIWHLNYQDVRVVDANDAHCRGKRRLSQVRDHCLDPQRVGPARLVPGPGTGDRRVVLDSDEEHAAAAVGKAHRRLDEVAVVQPLPLLALELDLAGLTAGDPARDTRDPAPCQVRWHLHARPLTQSYATRWSA